jgi:hypothetical protein
MPGWCANSADPAGPEEGVMDHQAKGGLAFAAKPPWVALYTRQMDQLTVK